MMCLGIPGRIVRWLDRDSLFASAEVEFEGVHRNCHMACVSGADIGDYVIVHAGIAIALVSESEAMRVLSELSAATAMEKLAPSNETEATQDETRG